MPDIFKSWPGQSGVLTPNEVVRMYSEGFAGAVEDKAARQALWQEVEDGGGWTKASDVLNHFGWSGSAAGQLVIPFVHVEKCFPGCWPGPAQERGDCVSHSEKNSCLFTLACEIVAGKPDESSGRIEGIPDVPADGIRNGVLSTEWPYWHRGYNGDGWSCDSAAHVTIKQGIMLRQAYPDLGIDLTRYSGGLAGKYGSKSPPSNMQDVGRQHLVRTVTEVETVDQTRDFLANGYGISSCGSEGWASSRDENGFSRRSGSWAHAMAYIGFDDRDIIKQKYGGPLVLILNSWGKWNGGGRRILGTTIDIPEGSFWAKWSDASRRYCIAHSGVNGWPAKKLPDLGATGVI